MAHSPVASTLLTSKMEHQKQAAQKPSRDLDDEEEEGSSSGDEGGSGSESGRAALETSTADEVSPNGFGVLSDENHIETANFEELHLPLTQAAEVRASWEALLSLTGSQQAAGEAFYAVLAEQALSLRSAFVTPRAVMGLKMATGMQELMMALEDPPALKVRVEALGFRHMNIEVTAPRVTLFRDALTDMLAVELGESLTPLALSGWRLLLNYVGGAFVYMRIKYTDRLRVLASSWETANRNERKADAAHSSVGEGEGSSGHPSGEGKTIAPQQGLASKGAVALRNLLGDTTAVAATAAHVAGVAEAGAGSPGGSAEGKSPGRRGSGAKAHGKNDLELEGQHVPQTFKEMFKFNAAVMGLSGHHAWMGEVLASFDTIVVSAGNPLRLQEECDVLSLRLAKHLGPIALGDYKAVMLASLRSLVPKDWSSAHEVAWGWLWENVERSLRDSLGKPAGQLLALESFFGSLDEEQLSKLKSTMFSRFFDMAPAAQNVFTQSNTRLLFIATRTLGLTVEIYKDPDETFAELSGIGLRHVGYDSPPELFGPFVTACIEVVRASTSDPAVHEAFSWSLSLISRVMLRTIGEGSTIVMKAINANSAKQLQKAISCAPRGERAQWMLTIQVGTQSISPLAWAVESGRLEAARAIIRDLLTIRADRERYYFGLDDMFLRHPDVIQRLCLEARPLLPELLDGLIWRSRNSQRGLRRVNYWVKHLVVGPDGRFAKALEWLTEFNDPEIACHPVIRFVADLVWDGVALRPFLQKNCWHIFSLIVFTVSQSLLVGIDRTKRTPVQRIFMGCIRAFIYVRSMAGLFLHHARKTFVGVRQKKFQRIGGVRVPAYLTDWQESASLVLLVVLVLMFTHEPILYCLSDHEALMSRPMTENCDHSAPVRIRYNIFSMIAVAIHWVRLLDMSVFCTRLSAHVLVCGRILPEFFLFLTAVGALVLAFGTSSTVLNHDITDFSDVGLAIVSYIELTLGMYGDRTAGTLEAEPVLAAVVTVFSVAIVCFFVNLLVAQMSSSYLRIYKDMVGFARLRRQKLLVEAVEGVSKARWKTFVESLHFDQKLEFNEGDVGLHGGVQVLEPASDHLTTVECVHRYGGPTGPTIPWPEEALDDGSEDRLQKLEAMMRKTMSLLTGRGHGSSHGPGSVGSSHSASSGGSESEGRA